MHLFFLLLVISQAFSDPVIGSIDPLLDPNRITWWRTKWAPSPLILSTNNKSVSSVTVTFFLSPTTSLSSGVLEITFPSGFDVYGVIGAVGQIVQTTQTFSGGQDYAVSVSGVTNPVTPGAYGPFALRTRFNPSGQVVDSNLSFGSVYITAAPGILGSLTVAFAGSAVNKVINKSGNSLAFNFTLGVSLWRYDTFIISVDSRWTVGNSAGCSSMDYTGRWNNFNGTNPSNPHSLDCVVTPKTLNTPQTVYIYGLAVDGLSVTQTVDNQYASLVVNSVTTPDRQLVLNTYSWTVSTSRFGTSTILETGTVVGVPLVSPDVIYSANWKPTWNMPVSNILSGLIVFMDLSFHLANPIPTGGGIQIILSEDVGSQTWPGIASNCFLVTPVASVVSTITPPSTIYINSFPGTPGGTLITVRNIVKFVSLAGAGVSAVSIQTYDSAAGTSNVIDAGLKLPFFSLATTGAIASGFNVQLLQGNGNGLTSGVVNPAGGTGDNTGYLTFTVQPSSTTIITSNSNVTIYCPIVSSLDDFNLSLPGYLTNAWKTGSALPVDMTTGTTTLSSVTITPGSITQLGTIQWSAAPMTGVGGATWINVSHSVTAGATSFIALPRISTNLATAYECRLELIDSGNVQPPTRYVLQVSINPQPFKTATFSMPCLDAIPGVPGIFQVAPNVIPLYASSNTVTYYIEFMFAVTPAIAMVNTGLSIGSTISSAGSYPHQNSLSTSGVTKVYSGSSSTTSVVFFNYPEIDPGTGASNQVTVYFPLLNALSGTTPSVMISSYYVLQADSRYMYKTHSSTASVTSALTVPTVNLFQTPTGTGTSTTTGQINNSGLVLNLKLAAAVTLTNTSPWVYFVFPQGYKWTSSAYAQNPGGSFLTSIFFSSPVPSFAIPGALVQVASGQRLTNAALTAYSLFGLQLPLGTPTGTQVQIIQGDSQGSGCVCQGTVALTATPGTITSVSILPTTNKSSGPDGINATQTLNFVLAHGLPATGSIRLVVSGNWQTTSCGTGCVVYGFPQLSISQPVTCTVASNTVIVSAFADFTSQVNPQVSIVLYHLVPPSTPGSYNFVTSLASYTQVSGGSIVDQYTPGTTTLVTITPSSVAGPTIWSSKKTYPMNAGAQKVDLYLKFSLQHALPTCGLISLTPPMSWRLSPGDNRNFCFLSPIQYSSCQLIGLTLQLTLSQDYQAGTALELYLDSAVDNPSTAVQTTNGFQITATWNGVVTDQDGSVVQQSQQFTPAAVTTGLITPNSNSIVFNPTTTGEPADYQFSFSDSVPYASGDAYWIVFPQEFDYFLGDVSQWFSLEKSTYYISCSSLQLGVTWCTVDHGIVVITGSLRVNASAQIVIVISTVVNPSPNQTGQFQIYHVTSSGSYVSVLQSFGQVTPTPFPSMMDFRGVVLTDSNIQHQAIYLFRLYITDSIQSSSQLRVTFPREYDLSHKDGYSSYPCYTTYVDQSNGAKVTSPQNWNSATTCQTSGNQVSLPGPTSAVKFVNTEEVDWTVENVSNPQAGITRIALSPYTDFDVTDYAMWPVYAAWTSKFSLFVYQTASSTYSSKTYPNLHSGYIGLVNKYKGLMITGGSSSTALNRISIFAGTQSTDFSISTISATYPCAAKSLVITPSTNLKTPDQGMLLYTSANDHFTLNQGFWQISFRVAAGINLAKGLFLIDWKIAETKQSGVTDNQYGSLPSTVLEVYQPQQGQFPITVASIPNTLVGYQSVPIQVTCGNAPHSDVTISLTVANSPPHITLSPASLTFLPDVTLLYFQIQVSLDYSDTSGSVQSLNFNLTGTDASVYSIISPVKFTVTQSAVTPTAGSILSWGLGTPMRTSIIVSPTVDQSGILYWHLSAQGSFIPPFQPLRNALVPLLNASSSGNSTSVTYATDPVPGETWTDFQHRLYKTHLMDAWIGALAVSSTTVPVTLRLNWLWAATSYQISGYLDNLNPYPVGILVHTETFTTKDVLACQPFTLKFQGQVSAALNSSIAQLTALYQGVNPLRLFFTGYSNTFTRRLQSILTYSQFSYTLVPDRFAETSDMATQAQITGNSLTSFKTDLNSTLSISSPLNSITNTPVPTLQNPTWTVSPKPGNVSSTSLSVVLRASVGGAVCCVALTTATAAPSATQVMEGLGPTNQNVTGSCAQTDLGNSTNTVLVSGLNSNTVYYLYCTAVDDYPLWGGMMIYTADSPIQGVSMTTSQATPSSNKTTDAMTFVLTGFALFAFL